MVNEYVRSIRDTLALTVPHEDLEQELFFRIGEMEFPALVHFPEWRDDPDAFDGPPTFGKDADYWVRGLKRCKRAAFDAVIEMEAQGVVVLSSKR